MKNIGLIIVFGITFFTVRVLNNGIRDLPPFGKILDPFHGFWQNAESKKIGISKTSLPLKGIKQEVSIFFDENMIPQITAQNDNDLYFAQGYVTAMQRLWQMDFQSYIAAGRVSEVVGLKALNFDILQRRKGLVYTANRIVTNLKDNSDYYEIVQSYTNGINAYIESLDYKHLPIEYKLLNYYPELFTIQKVKLCG